MIDIPPLHTTDLQLFRSVFFFFFSASTLPRWCVSVPIAFVPITNIDTLLHSTSHQSHPRANVVGASTSFCARERTASGKWVVNTEFMLIPRAKTTSTASPEVKANPEDQTRRPCPFPGGMERRVCHPVGPAPSYDVDVEPKSPGEATSCAPRQWETLGSNWGPA